MKNNNFNPKDYPTIKEKTEVPGTCGICGSWQIESVPHHIIFKNKTQNGTGHHSNAVFLCHKCHFQIHHGLNSQEYREQTYKYITDLILAWDGKIKPKIIRILECK